MSTPKAVGIGIVANKISKQITGQEETSIARTLVATGTGAFLGYGTGAVVTASMVVAAPVAIPLVIASAGVAFIASLFD